MTHKKYQKFYSEKRFWDKINELPAVKAPFCILLQASIGLYLLLKDPSVPIKVKSLILFSLGYFIAILDLIPDIAPFGIGLSDDIALLATVYGYVHSNLNQKTLEKIQGFLPAICKEDIKFDPTTRASETDPEIKHKINDILKNRTNTI